MGKDWKQELRDFFSKFDFSSAVLEKKDCKQFQFGGIKENKELFKKVKEIYPEYFKKIGDLGACLIYLKNHSVEDLLRILECPVCHKFNNAFRMNNSRGDEMFFCSRKCRYSKDGTALIMSRYKEKTGYDNPYLNPEVWKKRREHFKEKYGVETPMEFEEFKKKNHESNRKNHNGLLACQSQEIKDRIMETNLKNHDGVFNLNLEENKNKLKEKSLQEYGTQYPIENKNVREKQIYLYGGLGLASSQIREKAEKTFGGALNASNPKIFEKIKNTLEKKYGKSFKDVISERFHKALKKKYGERVGFGNEELAEKLRKIMLEKYGVPYYCMTDECRALTKNTISKRNKDFAEKLKKKGFSVGLDSVKLNCFSYDVCLEQEKILFEINPTITHNSTMTIFKEPKDKKYHLNKTVCAKEHGFRCIHIWDWDDEDSVIALIEKKQRISARACEVREISPVECNKFLSANHLQGEVRGQKVCIGLFFKGNLIQVMSFGSPRYNKSYQYELLRLASLKGLNIMGGAQKLLKYFERNFSPKSLISYCDVSKFTGNVYFNLGMSLLKQTEPSCHWVKGKKHFTDNLLRQQGADRLLGTCEGKGSSNEALMIENGFVKVFDCGQYVFAKNYDKE